MRIKPFLLVLAGACVVLITLSATRAVDLRGVIMGNVIGVSAICEDGSYSASSHDRGTCSHHGGVDRWLNDEQ